MTYPDVDAVSVEGGQAVGRGGGGQDIGRGGHTTPVQAAGSGSKGDSIYSKGDSIYSKGDSDMHPRVGAVTVLASSSRKDDVDRLGDGGGGAGGGVVGAGEGMGGLAGTPSAAGGKHINCITHMNSSCYIYG